MEEKIPMKNTGPVAQTLAGFGVVQAGEIIELPPKVAAQMERCPTWRPVKPTAKKRAPKNKE